MQATVESDKTEPRRGQEDEPVKDEVRRKSATLDQASRTQAELGVSSCCRRAPENGGGSSSALVVYPPTIDNPSSRPRFGIRA